MDFGLTLEQRQFDDSLRAFLADHLPMERLRALAEPGIGYDAALWNNLAELGLHGLLVPERFGGAGLGVLDAALAAEALGHAAAPVPFLGSIVMATLGLTNSATEAQQNEFLPLIAAGECRFAVALPSLSGQTGAGSISVAGNRLSGRLAAVADGGAATHYMIYLPDGHAAVVAADSAGVSARLQRSVDRTRPVVDVTFDGATAERLDAANAPLAAAHRVLDAGRVVLAADTLGAAQRMFDSAVAFAKERVQFGRVIGSFQGLKYTLAECVTALEPCRSMVWYAAYAQDALPDDARLTACQAKAHVGDVGRDIARLATEVHGGMGFTDLLGLHYWFKRISFNRQMLGGPERCREEAAKLQGWMLQA
jgi:alkylation response protein AidB-like acyl-CoA dehydrogenase